nr:MAG TPA: hypothetical protein [Caudoviricetes sp.]
MLIAFKILTKTSVRFPRSSFRLFLSPATEKAWQGVPPTKISGASISPDKIRSGNVVMSP